MTNYEKLKAMSLEELADWIFWICDAYYFPNGVKEYLESEAEEYLESEAEEDG